MVRDVHLAPIGICIRDGNADGIYNGRPMGHTTLPVDFTFSGSRIYDVMITYIYHVYPNFGLTVPSEYAS